jgi:photosystem II stability/assembly factor-like uncharacterized protein
MRACLRTKLALVPVSQVVLSQQLQLWALVMGTQGLKCIRRALDADERQTLEKKGAARRMRAP